MVSQFDPLFLTLLDLGVVTLEFLFVRETQNVLLQLVQVALLYFLLFDDLIEVGFDVKKRVHIGDVVGTLVDVERFLFHRDELLDFVGFVFDEADDEVTFERVEAFGLFRWLFETHIGWEAVEYFLDTLAVGNGDIDRDGCAAVDELVHVLVASVVVMDTARDFLLGGLVDYFDLPGVSAGSAVVAVLVACVDDEDGVLT